MTGPSHVDRDLLSTVREAVAGLPDEHRRVLLAGRGKPVAEIALQLELSEDEVTWRLHVALHALRQTLRAGRQE